MIEASSQHADLVEFGRFCSKDNYVNTFNKYIQILNLNLIIID